MLKTRSKITTAALLSSTALSIGVASALLTSCRRVVITVAADPNSLEFTASDFDGSGAATRTTTVCYTGRGQADCTAQVPPPFSLASNDGASSEQFTIEEGSCHDLVVALAEPADLEDRLDIVVSGDLISGTVSVPLRASAAADSGGAGDDGGSDGDGGGTDSGSTDGDGGTDSGGTDGGGEDTGGDTGDTGAVPLPCPAYSGLNSTLVRTYETSSTYTKSSGLSGTRTVSVDTRDPAAPVMTVDLSLTDRADNTTVTTERQTWTCDATGSTLVLREVDGDILGGDGSTTPIERTDTYSDGMLGMVPDFGDGGSVADIFTLEREEDGRTTTISGSNVVTSSGAATTGTPAGSFATMKARIQYAEASEAQDYMAYFDEELGMVKSFYWELVSYE